MGQGTEVEKLTETDYTFIKKTLGLEFTYNKLRTVYIDLFAKLGVADKHNGLALPAGIPAAFVS